MDNNSNKKIFISGGAGVIGTELVQKLIKKGAHLFVGDLKPKPSSWSKEICYRQGDLSTLTKEEIKDFSPEIFIHLAATFERSEETYDFWEENFHHNVFLSHHLMSIFKDLPSLQKVLFASSYLIYDPNQYLFSSENPNTSPLKETSLIAPRNLCGMTKLMHENELFFLKKFRPNLQIICARIFRSYGKNSRDIISRWIRALLKNEEITIYRQEGCFDFIYAEDVAEGLIRLSETSYDGIVNLGSGRSRKIEEVVAILKKHFGKISVINEESKIAFESSQADMHLFHQLTNWHSFRSLEETIPEILNFERAQEKKINKF